MTKTIFDQPVKNKQEAYEKLSKVLRNNDYATGIVLDYFYHQKYYKLIDIGLSRQTNTSIPKQINFIGKLDKHDSPAEKQQKTIVNISLDSLIAIE